MRELTFRQKIFLTVLESTSIFLSVFLNQMIITVFPAYESVKLNETLEKVMNSTTNLNCTMKDPSNSYVAIIIGSKYFTELIMFPIIGFIADHHHPPLILFVGLITETIACIIYSVTGNFYITILARIVDGLGYSLTSTSGLTIVYMLYLKDRPRNRIITIESVVVYFSANVSPYIAGYIFESLENRSEWIARLSTFMLLGPLFMIVAVLITPFAFENANLFSGWFFPSSKSTGNASEQLQMLKSKEPNFIDSDKKDEIEVKVDSSETVEIQSLSFLVLLKNKYIMITLMVLTFNSLVFNSLESTLPIFMIRKFCSDQREQGIVWLFGIMSLTGFFLSMFLVHHIPRFCWTLPCIGLLFNGALCVLLPFCQNWWNIGIIISFLGFHSSITEVILIPIIPKIIDKSYPRSSYGSGSSLTLITFTISGLIGTFPVGPLVDNFGFLTLCIILCIFNTCLSPFIIGLRSFFT